MMTMTADQRFTKREKQLREIWRRSLRSRREIVSVVRSEQVPCASSRPGHLFERVLQALLYTFTISTVALLGLAIWLAATTPPVCDGSFF